MNLLGISDHSTSGTAVLSDGRVVTAVNEGWRARKKMVAGFACRPVFVFPGHCQRLDVVYHPRRTRCMTDYEESAIQG